MIASSAHLPALSSWPQSARVFLAHAAHLQPEEDNGHPQIAVGPCMELPEARQHEADEQQEVGHRESSDGDGTPLGPNHPARDQAGQVLELKLNPEANSHTPRLH